MEEFTSSQFGVLSYEKERVIETPFGFPAFESERRFLAIEQPENAPVLFLQSLMTADLAFITVPVRILVRDYSPVLASEDLELLGWTAETPPDAGRDLLCLAIVTVSPESEATANLMAPIVVNLANRRAIQVIQAGGYSHQHPLGDGSREAEC